MDINKIIKWIEDEYPNIIDPAQQSADLHQKLIKYASACCEADAANIITSAVEEVEKAENDSSITLAQLKQNIQKLSD